MNNFKKGLIVFISIVVIGILVSAVLNKQTTNKYTIVVGAVGGGKENFLNDEEVNKILKEKYNIEVRNDDKSNNLLVKDPVTYTNDKGKDTTYDFVFFSDERFYNYYKTPARDGEAPREKVLGGKIMLNTPIVFYSWDKIADVLVKEGIVTVKDGVYYVSDTKKLLEYIKEGKKWADIGNPDNYGKINIISPDPVTSSPGETYYGLIASILNEGYVDETNINNVLPELKEFYKYSGFMNQTPSDIFDQYLRMGMGAKPIIVDYEKSMIDFANSNPEGYNVIKDKIRILYPEPTIWNSHCVVALTENGKKYLEAIQDKDIETIAFEKYGFRTGVVGGTNNLSNVKVSGIPSAITNVTPGLKKEIYDEIKTSLQNK